MPSQGLRTHTCGELRADHVGERVRLSGWVANHRDLGALVFLDLRDRHGVTQVSFDESVPQALRDAAKAGQDAVQARALFAERLGDKVHSSWTWKNYAGVLGNLGETEAAGQAADRARALVSA